MGRLGCSLFLDKRFADVTILLVNQQQPSPPTSASPLPPSPGGDAPGTEQAATQQLASLQLHGGSHAASPLPDGKRIRVHSVVLAAVSRYFDARLTRPLSATDPSAPVDGQGQRVLVEYCEDEATVRAAEAVLQCMYEEQVPSSLGMRELALMCRVADKWAASSCADTCFVALTQRRDEQLDRQAALAIVGLLPECVQSMPEYATWVQRCHGIILSDVAAGKDARPLLMAAFGDVQALLSTPTLLRLFLQLPFDAVVAWASSDELVVDSENSVVVAIDCWLQGFSGRNSQCKGDVTLRQLSACIRVQHLSPVYLLRLPQLSWFKHNGMLQHFTAAVLSGSLGGLLGPWDVPRSWTLPPRRQLPDDVLTQRATLRYEVPGVELTETRLKPITLTSPCVYMAGAAFCLVLGSGDQLSALSVGLRPADFSTHAEGKLITVVPPSVQPLQLEDYSVSLVEPGHDAQPWSQGRALCSGGRVSVSPPQAWVAPNLFQRNMDELGPRLVDGKLVIKAVVRVMRSTCAAAAAPAAQWAGKPAAPLDTGAVGGEALGVPVEGVAQPHVLL